MTDHANIDHTGITGVGSASFVGAKVYNAGVQVIATATATAITYGAEEFDTDSIHDTGTNPSRLTVPAGKGGKWLVTATVTFDAGGSAGTRAAWLRVNGTDVRGGSQSLNTNVQIKHNILAILNLTAGQYVEVMCYQNSTGNLNSGHASDLPTENTAMIQYLGT